MDADTKKEFMSLLPELFAVIKNKLNLQTTPKIVLKKDIEKSFAKLVSHPIFKILRILNWENLRLQITQNT